MNNTFRALGNFTLLLMAVSVMLAGGFTPASTQNKDAPWLPDLKLTPGAVDPSLTKEVICGAGWSTKSVRHTSAKVKAACYKKYGILTHAPGQYEVDHLVSLEIGGADVQDNLWPELYNLQHGDTNLGAHTKDAVENALHKAVCSDQISLKDAQALIIRDWVEAYTRFVKKPLPAWKK